MFLYCMRLISFKSVTLICWKMNKNRAVPGGRNIRKNEAKESHPYIHLFTDIFRAFLLRIHCEIL